MKRIISAVLVVAMLLASVLTLSSCGLFDKAPKKETYDVPEAGYDGSAVTIKFWHSMGQKNQAVLNDYIAEFNKIYPNITIEHTAMGDYDGVRDGVKTALTAGNEPHIAYVYPDHVALYNIAKAVVPLDNFIEHPTLGFTDAELANFVKGYYDEGAVYDEAGTMYTLPMSKSTEVLYYNKTFFEKNNLTVPTTWAQMEQLCKDILAIDPDCVPLGYDSEANWFISMTEQYESGYTSLDEDEHFIFDNDQNKAFVKMFRDWHQKGYVTTEEIYGSYTSGLFTATGDNQKCYMVIGSTGGASYQTPPTQDTADGAVPLFETGITFPPAVSEASRKYISQGPSLCMFKKDNVQEVVASWLFVKFLTSNEEFQAAFSRATGYAPVIKSVSENEIYKKWLNEGNGYTNLAALAVKQAIAQNDYYFVSPAFNGSSTARDQVGKLMQDALVYTGSDVDAKIAQLFKDAIDECEYAAD